MMGYRIGYLGSGRRSQFVLRECVIQESDSIRRKMVELYLLKV